MKDYLIAFDADGEIPVDTTQAGMMSSSEIWEQISYMVRNSSYAHTGWVNINEWAALFPAHHVIEGIIAFEGSSSVTWDFGHWVKYRDELISCYGDGLIPFLKDRIKNPICPSTPYEANIARVRKFCRNTLEKLELSK